MAGPATATKSRPPQQRPPAPGPAPAQQQQAGQAVALVPPPRLPYPEGMQQRFGVDKTEWRALTDAIFPLAKETASVILALSYCRARKLDIFKRPVHIVPMWSTVLNRMVETVWPGIGELRITAFRTGQYAGREPAKFGPEIKDLVGRVEMVFPEWCEVTVHRMLDGVKVTFTGPRVYWLETYAQAKRDDDSPNAMWKKRARGQLEKCAEAAALRAAFPEEVGSDYAAEEMEGKVIDGEIALPAEKSATMTAPASVKGRLDALSDIEEVDGETGEVLNQVVEQKAEPVGDGQREVPPQESEASQETEQAKQPEEEQTPRQAVISDLMAQIIDGAGVLKLLNTLPAEQRELLTSEDVTKLKKAAADAGEHPGG